MQKLDALFTLGCWSYCTLCCIFIVVSLHLFSYILVFIFHWFNYHYYHAHELVWGPYGLKNRPLRLTGEFCDRTSDKKNTHHTIFFTFFICTSLWSGGLKCAQTSCVLLFPYFWKQICMPPIEQNVIVLEML